MQAGDVSSGADFARAKRHKKLSARLNSATARARMTWLKRHSVYVLLFLLVTHTGGFIATRVLLESLKAHVTSVRIYLCFALSGFGSLFEGTASHTSNLCRLTCQELVYDVLSCAVACRWKGVHGLAGHSLRSNHRWSGTISQFSQRGTNIRQSVWWKWNKHASQNQIPRCMCNSHAEPGCINHCKSASTVP